MAKSLSRVRSRNLFGSNGETLVGRPSILRRCEEGGTYVKEAPVPSKPEQRVRGRGQSQSRLAIWRFLGRAFYAHIYVYKHTEVRPRARTPFVCLRKGRRAKGEGRRAKGLAPALRGFLND